MLLAHRQKTRLLGHDLWVAKGADGKWRAWIEGDKSVQHESDLADQDEAKRVVHSLAHWHIEGKHFCDCVAPLRWESVQPSFVGPLEERRRAKRIPYPCEIRCEDQGIFRIGRIGNLSTEGAFIQTLNPPFEGAVVNLSFKLGPVQVEAQGRVVHLTPKQGIGVQFLNLAPGYRDAIADIVARGYD